MLKQTHVTGLFVNAFSVPKGRRAGFPGAGFGIRMEFWNRGWEVLHSTAASAMGKWKGFWLMIGKLAANRVLQVKSDALAKVHCTVIWNCVCFRLPIFVLFQPHY